MGSMLKLIAIKTKDKIYISDNIENSSYFNSVISNRLFDDTNAKITYKPYWYEIEKLPTIVKQKSPDTYTNYRYELKAGFPSNDMIPLIIHESTLEGTMYEEMSGMYDRKCDKVEGIYEAIEFDIEVISELENFYIEKPKYPYSVSIIDSISIHPVLHPERPSSISGVELYRIIRSYIKNNINPLYAEISSDYDFCLTVHKKIKFTEPEKYSVNIGKRKTKLETRYRLDRKVTIFESAPKAYQSYTVQQGISGKNYQDLENKIEKYLSDLIQEINKPLIDCPSCKGLGVILDK